MIRRKTRSTWASSSSFRTGSQGRITKRSKPSRVINRSEACRSWVCKSPCSSRRIWSSTAISKDNPRSNKGLRSTTYNSRLFEGQPTTKTFLWMSITLSDATSGSDRCFGATTLTSPVSVNKQNRPYDSMLTLLCSISSWRSSRHHRSRTISEAGLPRRR